MCRNVSYVAAVLDPSSHGLLRARCGGCKDLYVCDSCLAAAPGMVYVSDWLTSIDLVKFDSFVLKKKSKKMVSKLHVERETQNPVARM